MRKNIAWGDGGNGGAASSWPSSSRPSKSDAEAAQAHAHHSGCDSQRAVAKQTEPRRKDQSKLASAKQFVLVLAAAGLLAVGLVAVGCSSTSSARAPISPSDLSAAFALTGTVVTMTNDGEQLLAGARVEATNDSADANEGRPLRRRVTSTSDD